MVAPLQHGYYLIGRKQECQIRPKSRSVSRRHCLVRVGESGLQVRDLDSTSGTYVNEDKAPPYEWVVLHEGDVLRCGKIHFRVSIGKGPPSRQDAEAIDQISKNSESLLTGQAWQDIDVAGLLESEDDADREARYERIRQQNGTAPRESPADSDSAEITSEINSELDSDEDDEFDDLEDAFSDDVAFGGRRGSTRSTKRGRQASPSTNGKAAEVERSPADSAAAADTSDSRPDDRFSEGDKDLKLKPLKDKASKSNRKSPKRKPGKPTDIPKKRKKRASSSTRGFSLSLDSGAGLKAAAVIVVTLLILGFLGYQIHQFYSGPSVRVIQNID